VRVCLDTNVLVAAFATRGLCADVLRVCLTEHDLVIGDVQLQELRRVLSKKLRVPSDQIAAAEAVFAGLHIVPRPPRPVDLPIRDPADRWILATAIAGHADILVTGDEDLLDVADQSPVLILKPRGFWEMLTKDRK